MSDNSQFMMDPAAVNDAARRLDTLAERMDGLMKGEATNLTVTAAGSDEVSSRVAATLNDVHSKFAASVGQGSNEIREIAATLRAHATNVADADSGGGVFV